ncbi:MAG: amidase [Acidimicrobiales bacterium]|nr:amidase [Acidimicrobiales bacterium]
MTDDLAALDATGQAELVRSGQASATDLVEAAIARIEAVNPTLNAVIHERFDRAREEAAGELPDGPFRGVPFLLKDLGAKMAGEPYHAGTVFLKELGWRASADTYLVQRVRAAGLVIVGRTNTPEFGSTITTEPVAHGPSRNPWNTEHSTGGSSGGSAAAVASRMVPAAHANDGGGSIRIPASECGLVGLKPSRGRVSLGPDLGEDWAGFTIDGSVTRTVRDTAGLLDVLAGQMPGDPYMAPPPARPFRDEVGADPGALRIGLQPLSEAAGIETHPECVAAVEAAGLLLEGLGHRVERSHPSGMDDDGLVSHFVNVLAVSQAREFERWEEAIGRPVGPDEVEPGNWMYGELGKGISGPQYVASIEWLHRWSRRIASWWHDGFDLLVTPTLAAPPPRLGELNDPDPGVALLKVASLLRFTPQFNVTGQPAISLPLHWTADGLPVGVQLVAAYGREDLLLRVAAQLERAAPWAADVPPVSA